MRMGTQLGKDNLTLKLFSLIEVRLQCHNVNKLSARKLQNYFYVVIYSIIEKR